MGAAWSSQTSPDSPETRIEQWSLADHDLVTWRGGRFLILTRQHYSRIRTHLKPIGGSKRLYGITNEDTGESAVLLEVSARQLLALSRAAEGDTSLPTLQARTWVVQGNRVLQLVHIHTANAAVAHGPCTPMVPGLGMANTQKPASSSWEETLPPFVSPFETTTREKVIRGLLQSSQRLQETGCGGPPKPPVRGPPPSSHPSSPSLSSSGDDESISSGSRGSNAHSNTHSNAHSSAHSSAHGSAHSNAHGRGAKHSSGMPGMPGTPRQGNLRNQTLLAGNLARHPSPSSVSSDASSDGSSDASGDPSGDASSYASSYASGEAPAPAEESSEEDSGSRNPAAVVRKSPLRVGRSRLVSKVAARSPPPVRCLAVPVGLQQLSILPQYSTDESVERGVRPGSQAVSLLNKPNKPNKLVADVMVDATPRPASPFRGASKSLPRRRARLTATLPS